MPRIPDHLLDRIKREIPVRQLVERAGIELRGLGDNLAGRCNRHDDSTASLIVTPDKNLFHCMGACQKGGSVIDWVMWQKDTGFHQAARELAEEFFSDEATALFGRKAEVTKRRREEELPCPLSFESTDEELARDTVTYYAARLEKSSQAQEYLEKRGLLDAGLIERFRLGYADRTLGMSLSVKLRKRLQALGYFRESGHEHLAGSIVVPFFGETGDVLGCYGRKINDNLRPGTPDHLYLPGPHRGLLNREALAESKELILCEAPLDAATFYRHGFHAVTTCYGADGYTEELHAAIAGSRIKKVLFAFDRDEAGDRGAEKIAKRLGAQGISCFRVLFPKGMDANDVATKMHPAEKTLALFLRSAQWIAGAKPLGGAKEPAKPGTGGAAAQKPRNGHEGPKTAALEIETPCAVELFERPAEAAKKAEPGEAAKKGMSPAQDASDAPSASGLVAETPDEAVFLFEDRRYRVRGLAKATGFETLKLNVLVTREADFIDASPFSGLHADTFDLYASRARALFEKDAARELGVDGEAVHKDLGRILRVLEELKAQRIAERARPRNEAVVLTPEETEEALAFWRSPDLLARIVADMTECGLVGEPTNKLLTYVGATSRLLHRPLAVIVQSSSAAGKTSLMEAVLSLMPEESREKYTAVSGKSLFYFGDDSSLRHKILAIVEEEGAEKATYPLKLLQSEGELVMASTGKDPQTGKLVTQVYRVEGPVMIILTTTAIELDPELENRCLRLTVDESREQTRRIHELQRRRQSLEGLFARKRKERIEKLHRNAQRLLRPLHVLNPYERHLTFVDDQTRTRRDHDKYLTLIEALALLHQYQRPTRTIDVDGEIVDCVEVTLADIETANRLAGEVLGRTLDDLPPQTRRFLGLLHEKVKALAEEQGVSQSDLHFTRRDVRAFTGWGNTQVFTHLARLVELEYALPHRSARGQGYVYELLWRGEGEDGTPFVLGLVDVETLRKTDGRYDGQDSGCGPDDSGAIRAGFGTESGDIRPPRNPRKPAPQAAARDLREESARNARLPDAGKVLSYLAARRGGTGAPRLNLLRFAPLPATPATAPTETERAAAPLALTAV
ncbi:MAG: toprim domain-containing protein [Acidobacteria bacterium]|nr:toprim domain-containing protein [Acidobacteriota bacterium]